jgi:hypothetical protein
VKLVRTVLEGFCDVFWLYDIGFVEVGYGAGKLNRAHVRAGGKAEFFGCGVQHVFGGGF